MTWNIADLSHDLCSKSAYVLSCLLLLTSDSVRDLLGNYKLFLRVVGVDLFIDLNEHFRKDLQLTLSDLLLTFLKY